MNFYQRMGILPLKKCVNRDKCSFATKQRMFGVFAIDEILRYRWTPFVGSRTLCHPGSGTMKRLTLSTCGGKSCLCEEGTQSPSWSFLTNICDVVTRCDFHDGTWWVCDLLSDFLWHLGMGMPEGRSSPWSLQKLNCFPKPSVIVNLSTLHWYLGRHWYSMMQILKSVRILFIQNYCKHISIFYQWKVEEPILIKIFPPARVDPSLICDVEDLHLHRSIKCRVRHDQLLDLCTRSQQLVVGAENEGGWEFFSETQV